VLVPGNFLESTLIFASAIESTRVKHLSVPQLVDRLQLYSQIIDWAEKACHQIVVKKEKKLFERKSY